MTIEFRFPELGESIHDVEVAEVLVQCGDQIEIDQFVLEVETEKALIEIPCPHAGRVASVHVVKGDAIRTGSLLLTMFEPSGTDLPPGLQQNDSSSIHTAAAHSHAAEPGDRPDLAPLPAAPAALDLAQRLGIDLLDVRGTGTDGRVSQEDVETRVRERLRADRTADAGRISAKLPDFSCFGPVERRRLSRLQLTAANQLCRSWQLIPQATHQDHADITELELARQKFLQIAGQDGPKITLTSIVMKACVQLLVEMPHFNSSLDSERDEVVLKRYYHIGVAVDTEFGLIVPVIHDVDKKSILEIAVDLSRLAKKARQRKLDLAELQGASFTITNLGGIGGTALTPIVNHPEVAILGLARARRQPEFVDGVLTERLMLPLSLSFDHRVINGADAARFVARLSTSLNAAQLPDA